MLDVCAEPLRKVAAEIPFELRVLAATDAELKRLNLKGVSVRWIPIDRCDIIQQLHHFDIGLMPLPSNDRWMEYKGNAKAIQYMAVGVPVIASDIGFNRELVSDGIDSLLVRTQEDWINGLRRLLMSPEQRTAMGAAARQKVLSRFTVQSRLEEYESILMGRHE